MGTKKTTEITRSDHTMRATIEQMDNGAQMVIRKHASNVQSGTIVLKRVYMDFDSLVADLRDNMEFNFPKK